METPSQYLSPVNLYLDVERREIGPAIDVRLVCDRAGWLCHRYLGEFMSRFEQVDDVRPGAFGCEVHVESPIKDRLGSPIAGN